MDDVILEIKRMTKQSKRTDLYARRKGLANEQPPFDLQAMLPSPTEITPCA